jgi:hypothetical protein
METTHCHDCGAAIAKPDTVGPTGYALDGDGRKICYPCSTRREREYMAGHDRFTGYLSADGKTVQTWPGGIVGRVTYSRQHVGRIGGNSYGYCTVDVTAFDGARWYGRGQGPGMILRLRRRRVSPPTVNTTTAWPSLTPTPYGFSCGLTQTITRRGNAATISRENGVYMVRRSPHHPAGWLVRTAQTVTGARKLAAAIARGDSPEA